MSNTGYLDYNHIKFFFEGLNTNLRKTFIMSELGDTIRCAFQESIY